MQNAHFDNNNPSNAHARTLLYTITERTAMNNLGRDIKPGAIIVIRSEHAGERTDRRFRVSGGLGTMNRSSAEEIGGCWVDTDSFGIVLGSWIDQTETQGVVNARNTA